jgi:hypothetical protein
MKQLSKGNRFSRYAFALVLGMFMFAPAKLGAFNNDKPAPDIGGAPWINSKPLTSADLRGRVVLVEFWTYG